MNWHEDDEVEITLNILLLAQLIISEVKPLTSYT